MPSYAFHKCNNNTKNTNKSKGVTFHSFPQDPRCKEKWIKIIQRDQRDEEWLPTKFSRVCSAHFKENDLYVTPLGRRKLKLNAIPTFRPATTPSQDLPPDQDIPSSPLRDVNVSDTDSNFDTPRKIHLKKELGIEKRKSEKCRRQIMKLKKQNKYLKSRNICLRDLVKSLKKEKYFDKEDYNELAVKAEKANIDFLYAIAKKRKIIPPTLRQFCATLHYYSPGAYKYIRRPISVYDLNL